MEKYKYWFSIELENGQFDRIGDVVRKKIKEDTRLEDEVKKILLNYPVVYVHSWKSGDKTKLYIGETIDIVRRTDEHEKMGEAEYNTWQTCWKDGTDHRSFFFSSPDMNKSLALDIEDCLMKRFVCVNHRNNPQTDYSNKGKRDALLEQIICTLENQGLTLKLKSTTNDNEASHRTYMNDMNDMAVYSTINIVNKIDGIRMFTTLDEFPFKEYPVVYMHLWRDDNGLHTYVGETDDFQRRTGQHEDFFDITDLNDNNWHTSWQKAEKEKKMMLVFGHKEMNTSVTRDIEDLLIIYTKALQKALPKALGLSVNGRRNPQRDYDNRESMHPLFCKIVAFLNQLNGSDFKSLDTLKKEAPFLASPLIELSDDQKEVKEKIVDEITARLQQASKSCHVLIISGTAGTGKTVLASSVFFDLCDKEISARFLVNHKELKNTYQTQFNNRNLSTGKKSIAVSAAENYINECKRNNGPVCDVVLVDEAHLLHSENNNGRGKGEQIERLAQWCKVLVLMIDPDQYVKSATMWAPDLSTENMKEKFQALFDKADVKSEVHSPMNLIEQFRMKCSPDTFNWIKSIPTNNDADIASFPYTSDCKHKELKDSIGNTFAYEVTDETGYVIRIYTSLAQMAQDIENKKKQDNPSALIASYCWRHDKDFPIFQISGSSFFWHEKKKSDGIWTLAPTMKAPGCENAFEVGAIHDIQGFDLNYAGVILGKSFIIDPDTQKIKFELHRKSWHEEGRVDLKGSDDYETLIRNEINVLLTRGMKGLYIYAVDDELRGALIEAVKKP